MKNPLKKDVGSAGIAAAVVLGTPVFLVWVVAVFSFTRHIWGPGVAMLWLLGIGACVVAGVVLHASAPRRRAPWVPWVLAAVLISLPIFWRTIGTRDLGTPGGAFAAVLIGWGIGAGIRVLVRRRQRHQR